ncbi:MAG: PAS domain S-box protein, partial [Deltaproteobacteria bacterium]|nr:PAS domain S-box protein [Deltaproteobacteria bacterium]
MMINNHNPETQIPVAQAQIMVVEDELILAEDIRSNLTALGYSVPDAAVSGEEAIHQADEIRPDLVLMDIKLQGKMDGIEAAEQIRVRFDIPVIYLTAFSDAATLQRAKITEPFGYIIKPAETRELHATIEMALYRRRLESKLKESEHWLDTTLRSIGDGVIATDDVGRVVFMNPVAEELTGWKQAEAAGRDLAEVFRIVNETTGETVENPATRVLQEGVAAGLANHTLLISKDGAKIPIDDSGAPIRADDGTISGVVLTFRDITERRRSEEALRKSEEKHRALIENLSEMILIIDKDGVNVWNSPAVRQYGMEPEDAIGINMRDYTHPDDRDRVDKTLKYAIEHPGEIVTLEGLKVIPDDGREIFLDDTFVYLPDTPGINGLVVTCHDITERKQAEEALKESESLYRTLVETSTDGIVLTDFDGKYIFANKRHRTLLGYDSSIELVGKNGFDFIAPEYKQAAKKTLQRLIDEKYVDGIVFEVVKKDGGRRITEFSATVISDEDGKPVSIMCLMRDITERKQAEDALRESEERYRLLIETSPDAITVTDLSGKLIMANQRNAELHGCERAEELLGLDAFELIAPADRQRAMENTRKTLETGGIKNIEYTMLRRDGTPFSAEISASALVDSAGKPTAFLGVVRDITERKQAEEALRESEEKHRTYIENAPDGIFIADSSGGYVDANQAACRMTGYSRAELLNMSIPELASPESPPKTLAVFN